MYIKSWIHINDDGVLKNGNSVLSEVEFAKIAEPQDLYRKLSYSYMKFFKMDLLCKWAWLGAELLLQDDGNAIYENVPIDKAAVTIGTKHGCLDVDKKYEDSRADIPSPALFVYTLPNIMLGEICIRHGFKGEQLCTVSEGFDAEELNFWVDDLLTSKGMEACLCGWADAYEDKKDICLFWVTKQETNTPFTKQNITSIYNS